VAFALLSYERLDGSRMIQPVPKDHLAMALLHDAGNRVKAERLLREACRSRFASAHMVLGVMLEDRDPKAASKHLGMAKRHWTGPGEFEAEAQEFRGIWSLHLHGSR